MGEQQVFVNPQSYQQGVNTAIAQQNTNLGQLNGFYNLGTEVNKRADLTNLYDNAKQNNTQPTWEEIGEVYAKYGDTDGADRAKERAYKQKATKFGERAKIYMNQAEKAYASGNNDALMTVQKNANDDPYVKEFIGEVNFLPNDQISYVVQEDQDVLMDGGITKKANKGDQVLAYKGEDANGQPKFYATSIKPTGLSTAVQRSKTSSGKGASPKSITSFNNKVDSMVTGKGQFSDEIYNDAIALTKNPKLAHGSYIAAQNFIDTEVAQNYLTPKALETKRDFVEKTYGNRLKEFWENAMQTKEFEKINKERNSQKSTLYIMDKLGIPADDYEEIVGLLQKYPPKKKTKK